MFFTVAVVTLVAWFPLNSFYLVLAYIAPYTSDELDTLNIIHVIVKLLVATNTFTSSILYFIFDKHYRVSLICAMYEATAAFWLLPMMAYKKENLTK